jgi:hypothetical protein
VRILIDLSRGSALRFDPRLLSVNPSGLREETNEMGSGLQWCKLGPTQTFIVTVRASFSIQEQLISAE